MIPPNWYDQAQFPLIWIGYVLSSIPIVFLLLLQLPRRLKHHKRLNLLFFYILSAAIFLFGIVLTFIIIRLLVGLKPKSKESKAIRLIEYPDYQHSPQAISTEYGEGLGFKIVQTQSLPKAVRERMLVAVNQFVNPLVNRINLLALSDDVDEMRLYAQSLIEKQERRISAQLKKATHRLALSGHEINKAYYKKQIAEILWEQVYRHLMNQEILPSLLNKIRRNATEALTVLSTDIELPILLTKIALRENDLLAAKKWLAIALDNHAPVYKIVSYLGEIAFIEKDFTLIKKLYSESRPMGVINLQPVISFWVKNE